MTLGVYIRNPFSVHLQCFSVCIIGDFSVRESVLPFWGGKKRRRRRLAFLLGAGGRVGGVRRESDRLQSLTALHYLSWGGCVRLWRRGPRLGPNVAL